MTILFRLTCFPAGGKLTIIMERPYKRRRFLINKAFQYRYIAWVVGAMSAAMLVVLLDVFITLHRHCVDAGLQIRVTDLYSPTAPLTVLKLVVYAASVVGVSLLLSHRIAGPLFRFEKSAERVAAGDLSLRVVLRKEDEFLGFQDKFNGMLESLRNRVSSDVESAAKTARDLDALSRAPGLPPSAVEVLQRASADLAKIGKSFRLS